MVSLGVVRVTELVACVILVVTLQQNLCATACMPTLLPDRGLFAVMVIPSSEYFASISVVYKVVVVRKSVHLPTPTVLTSYNHCLTPCLTLWTQCIVVKRLVRGTPLRLKLLNLQTCMLGRFVMCTTC